MRKVVVLVAGAGAAIALAACGNGPPADNGGGGGGGGGAEAPGQTVNGQTAGQKVSATDAQKFTPATVSVKVGDVVEWDNTGSILHNISFDSEKISDSNFDKGNTFQVKFTKAGNYKYQCTIHANMTGEVDVQ